jgi:deoxyribose-phosphate aldolase
MNVKEICKLIDHTQLNPGAAESDIRKLANEAIQYGFGTCCVNQCWIRLLSRELKGTGVKVCSVVGFPLGTTITKAVEAEKCVSHGADEIDMVMNVGFLKSGLRSQFEEDIKQVVIAASGKLVKVILEAGLLTNEEKVEAAKTVMNAGAKFVKTSTGLGHGGATVEDIELLRRTVGPDFGVKASGGVRTWDQVVQFVTAGASRIGTSAGVQIAREGER